MPFPPDRDAFGRGFRVSQLVKDGTKAPDGWEKVHKVGLSGSALESPVYRVRICEACGYRWPCDIALAGVLERDGRAAAERMPR